MESNESFAIVDIDMENLSVKNNDKIVNTNMKGKLALTTVLKIRKYRLYKFTACIF